MLEANPEEFMGLQAVHSGERLVPGLKLSDMRATLCWNGSASSSLTGWGLE